MNDNEESFFVGQGVAVAGSVKMSFINVDLLRFNSDWKTTALMILKISETSLFYKQPLIFSEMCNSYPKFLLLFQNNILAHLLKMQCHFSRFQTSWATNYVDWKLVISFTNFPPIRIISLHRFLIRIHYGGCKKYNKLFFWITLRCSLG